MASNFEKYLYDKHGVFHATLMHATDIPSAFYTMVNEDAEMENGSVSVLKPENYVEDDVFKVEAPKITDKVVILANDVKIYEEYTKRMQEESQYFIGQGERIRAFETFETDRFSLSKEAFKDETEVEVGKYVVVDGTGFKLTTAAEDPNKTTVTHGFVGYIYKQWPNGEYIIMRKLLFAEYTDLNQKKFKDAKDIKTFTKICIDTYNGTLQNQSVADANTVIRTKFREIAGLSEDATDIQIKRALGRTAVREALFEIIEDTIDDTLVTGWSADPFFRKYVDFKNTTIGEKNSFYIKDDCILTVAKLSGGQHAIERQRLGAGQTRTVSTSYFGLGVYMSLLRFMQGVEDWNELINKITEAFDRYVNTMLHDAVMSASQQLPVPTKWNIKGEAKAENRAKLKRLISDVQLATGSKAVIMGTEVALGELQNFGSVQWISNEAKSDIYRMGRLGSFEGTEIVEIPQAFAYNDVEHYLEDDKKLLIMPNNIDKFVKFVYEGSDATFERNEILPY